jgi:hypothetical protein
MQTNNRLNTLLSSFSDEARTQLLQQAETIKPILDEVHSHQATGQHYYSDYMRIISLLRSKRPNVGVKVWGVLFLIAGANPLGVEAAVKNL